MSRVRTKSTFAIIATVIVIGLAFTYWLPAIRTDLPPPVAAESTVTYRKGNDPVLARAAAEAKAHWSKFSKAFAEQNKDAVEKAEGDALFQVKAPATGNGATEHFWINVDGIKGDDISGKYDCDGIEVKSIHENDPVHVKLADIEDWMMTINGQKQGGYSVLVLIYKGIAQTNHVNDEGADRGAGQYAKLQQHWAKVDASKGKNMTDEDKSTMELVSLVERIELGNKGSLPSDEDLAKTCHLPVEMVKSIRHVRNDHG